MRNISTKDILVVIFVVFAVVVCYSVAHHSSSQEELDQTADNSSQQGPFTIIDKSKAVTAPDFTIPSTDGLPINLMAAAKSGPVVIDFWAIWCKPCNYELPDLDQTYLKYRGQGVQFFGINSDADATTINHFFSKQHLSFPMLVDSQGIVNQSYGVTALPTICVIDRDGKVRAVSTGYDPSTVTDLSSCIEQLLKEH